MKTRIFRYLKHISVTVLVILLAGIAFVLSLHGSLHYGDDPIIKRWNNDGPYVFFTNDSILQVSYVTGNRDDGYRDTSYDCSADSNTWLSSHFNLDGSHFDFEITTEIETPAFYYDDGEDILAISDIESGYRTFRDFLIAQEVINDRLEWIFGKGHLVLNGDFVDRGFSTTQVLWLIYKLEKEARLKGGNVHFVLGNHEIKLLQGNYGKSSLKYFYVAAILGKQQFELYDNNSLMGRWLASKNTLELINGNLFVHGGLHPDLANHPISLASVNQIVRENYRRAYFPKKEDALEDLLVSTTKGPSWYRGYFKNEISMTEIDGCLDLFGAKAVIVGHTIQGKVKSMHEGKVYSIDVNHPKDYQHHWPVRASEGLFISGGKYYRAFSDGKRTEI
ncbi:hypothetical protein CEQ90_13210 [Lewinellaceae bacterium SD302]|nr:hypothetical protein CEQ90_13210 [Lewinellaceae bacterium SD302]